MANRLSSLKKAQFAIEFVVLLAVMFLIFLAVLSLATNKILSTKEQQRKQTTLDLAQLAKSEIDLAQRVADGYNRTFLLPARADGSDYNISIVDNRELIVRYADQEHVFFLGNNIIGNISPGLNVISKQSGTVYLQAVPSQIECEDEQDNDGDGQTDLADSGCGYPSDNDESDCGDLVCEGLESCLSCGTDCGICPAEPVFFFGLDPIIMRFEQTGNAILKGLLRENVLPSLAGDEGFIGSDSSSNPIFALNFVTGNLDILGNLLENQTINPGGNGAFFIQGTDETIAYFDELGNFYLKGTLEQNGSP